MIRDTIAGPLSFFPPPTLLRSKRGLSFRLVLSRTLSVALIFTLLSMSASAQTHELTSEVWAVVESYTQAHAAEDLALYLSYFHPEFKGWYFGDSTMTTREDREVGLTYYFSVVEFIDYRPELDEATIHGDVAIVHYTLHQRVRWSDGTEQEWQEFWTDILVRNPEGEWKLRHDHGHRVE